MAAAAALLRDAIEIRARSSLVFSLSGPFSTRIRADASRPVLSAEPHIVDSRTSAFGPPLLPLDEDDDDDDVEEDRDEVSTAMAAAFSDDSLSASALIRDPVLPPDDRLDEHCSSANVPPAPCAVLAAAAVEDELALALNAATRLLTDGVGAVGSSSDCVLSWLVDRRSEVTSLALARGIARRRMMTGSGCGR